MAPGIDGSQTLPATSLTSDSDESPMTSVRTGPTDFGLRLYCGISVALVLVVSEQAIRFGRSFNTECVCSGGHLMLNAYIWAPI